MLSRGISHGSLENTRLGKAAIKGIYRIITVIGNQHQRAAAVPAARQGKWLTRTVIHAGALIPLTVFDQLKYHPPPPHGTLEIFVVSRDHAFCCIPLTGILRVVMAGCNHQNSRQKTAGDERDSVFLNTHENSVLTTICLSCLSSAFGNAAVSGAFLLSLPLVLPLPAY